MNDNINRIWQPIVEPNDNSLPLPSTTTTSNVNNNSNVLYTKTSLASSRSDREDVLQNKIKQYNREVLTTSQSFNNSPKPFTRSSSSLSGSISNNYNYNSTLNSSTHNFVVGKPSTPIKNLQINNKINNNSELNSSSSLSPSSLRQKNISSQQHQNQQQPSIKFISQLSQVAELIDSSSLSGVAACDSDNNNKLQHNSDQQQQQEENMAPKLIHKQYNSPIDLYSMNNIRKTIEAHTELIAPGIKGINFMKPETPVNKQSEVYKLVMEEEQQGQKRQPSPKQSTSAYRLSPTTSGFGGVQATSNSFLNQRQATPTIQEQQFLESTSHPNQMQQQQHVARITTAGQQQSRLTSTIQQDDNQQQQQQQPSCCECGQLIVGAFARIGQNRCIHPQCFNCTTCGTSLKNIGYFTVNDKLYCEIHAKQVANIMRLNYNFNEKKNSTNLNKQQSLLMNNHQQNQVNTAGPATSSNEVLSKPTKKVEILSGGEYSDQLQKQNQFKSYAASSSFNNQPATISTMFANRRSNSSLNRTNEYNTSELIKTSEDSQQAEDEIRWTWRPMTSKEVNNTNDVVLETGSSSTNFCPIHHNQKQATTSTQLNLSSINQQQQQQQQQNYQQEQQHQYQQSIGVRGKGLLQAEGSLIAGRIPICIHCNNQIHGPYILAGKTTWCKLCGQNYFNCQSCKRSLLEVGFIELDNNNFHKYYCENCFEIYYSPQCSKCNLKIKGDCLNALQKQWHPSCFVCGHCRRPFGNSSFYLEDNVPYCERDWNLLFTTKCYSCSYPIQAGDRWIEALSKNYHSNCFKCSSCQTNLEGSTFYCKNGKPYCRLHAR